VAPEGMVRLTRMLKMSPATVRTRILLNMLATLKGATKEKPVRFSRGLVILPAKLESGSSFL